MGRKVVPPDIGGEEESVEEEVEESGKEEKGAEIKGNMPVDVRVALERISTQITALNEIREGNNERFVRMSEQIGEIRNMVIENEKHMRDIEVKATKAADLVSAVKPETLSGQVMKIDTKVEALKAKIEAGKTINDSIIEELKSIKRQISLFKGTEAILRLNNDTKKELLNIQKIKAITGGHADKIEQIFIEIQKNFADFQKLEDKAENAVTISSNLQKELHNLTIKSQTSTNKRDLDDLRKKVNSNFEQVNKQVKDIKNNKDLIALLKSIEVKLIESIGYNKEGISQLKKEKKKMGNDIDDIYSFLKQLTKKINKKYPDKQIEEVKKQLKENKKQRSELLKVVEMVEKKVHENKNKRKT